MLEHGSNSTHHWHSPERAWTPLMWIIAAVAFALSAMVLAPLAPVVSAAASGASSASATTTAGPDAALADAAKALAEWSATPTPSPATADRLANSGSSAPAR